MRSPPPLWPATALPLLAQTDSVPVLAYGAALVATALVLLVVCWPARRE
jgi:hypothetical protein